MIDYGWSVNEVATTIASVVAALGALSLAFKTVRAWIGRQWRRLRGSAVSPAELSAKFESLRAEISTAIADHSNEIRDEIRSMAGQVAEVLQVSSQVREALGRVGLLESMLRLAADREESVGTIYCDDAGQVTFVSRSVTQWLQASRSDLLGMRWLNYVAPPERKPFRDEFTLARQDHRELRMSIHMGPHGEEPRAYMLTISPMPDNPPAEAWSGHLRPMMADGFSGSIA